MAPNRCIFVAAMWRSGSLHIANGLTNILGWRKVSTAGYHGEGQEEQNINPFSAGILFPYGDSVLHQHMCATFGNVTLLRDLGVRPVVVIRNLPDTLVSLKERIDHLHKLSNMEEPGNYEESVKAVIPGLYVPSAWEGFTEAEKWEWVVYNATPWQLRFYVSWKTTKLEHLTVRYEQFYADEERWFRGILGNYGLFATEQTLADAVKDRSNFSVGQVGRGARLIPDGLKRVVEQQVKSWGSEMSGQIWEELL